MQLIKNGKWKDPWTGTFICKPCEAQILVEEQDLVPKGNEVDINYFNCIECEKIGYVPKEQLPLRLKEALNKTRKYWSSSGDKD